MARILLAWEHGMGLGHVAMLVPIAKALRARGHTPVLALCDRNTTRPLWEHQGFEVIQAPLLMTSVPKDHGVDIHTLADVLFLAGYADATKLMRLTAEWQTLAQRERIDAVIAEYSPTAAISYRGIMPFITVGTPFSVPPEGMRMPNIRAWENAVPEVSGRHEALALSAINTVRKQLTLAPFDFLSDMFGGEGVFVLSYPELDVYAALRKHSAIGPVSAAIRRAFTPFAPPKKPSAFLYLSGKSSDIKLSLESLDKAGMPCDTFIRNFAPNSLPPPLPGKESEAQNAARAEGYRNIHFHDAPQDLQKILKERSVIVHHGGHATSCEALAFGIPQLILASQLEQQMTASRLMGLQCALGFARKQRENDPTLVTKALHHLAREQIFWENAQKKASEIALRHTQDPADTVADAVVRLCSLAPTVPLPRP